MSRPSESVCSRTFDRCALSAPKKPGTVQVGMAIDKRIGRMLAPVHLALLKQT